MQPSLRLGGHIQPGCRQTVTLARYTDIVHLAAGGGGGGVVHAPRILCHISILVTALEFCSTV